MGAPDLMVSRPLVYKDSHFGRAEVDIPAPCSGSPCLGPVGSYTKKIKLPHDRFTHGQVWLYVTEDAGSRYRRNSAHVICTTVINEGIARITQGSGTADKYHAYYRRDLDGQLDSDVGNLSSSGKGVLKNVFIKNDISPAELRIRWVAPPPVCNPLCRFSIFRLNKIRIYYLLYEV